MLHKITFALLIIGGLNWGLEAFGAGVGRILPEWLSMLIYILVGVSALVEIFTHKANCKCCDASMQKPM
jgi:uncharacterized membrane protein YuzA (DUF378 family)